MNYLPEVRSFVVDNFLFGDGTQLENSTSFLENGIIDSTGILEIVTFLEEKYGVAIEDDELVPENLDTLENIASFVERKVQTAQTAE